MHTSILILRSSALLALAASAAAQATFVDVGSIHNGHDSRFWAVARSGNGIAGGEAWFNNDTEKHAVRWTGVLEDLDDLPGGLSNGGVGGLSWDGSIAVGTSESTNGDQAFRWESGTGMVGLGDLPGGPFASYATGVNGDGSWIVGLATDAVATRAVRWNSLGAIELLGSLPGGTEGSQALAITPDGMVIVGNADTGSDWWPFRWTLASGIQPLSGFLPQMVAGRAEGVSDDGQVVVGFAATPTYQHAFRWTAAGGMESLGYLPGGIYAAIAKDCNGDGSVVVGGNLFDGPGGVGIVSRATIWDSTNGLRSLQEVLEVDHGLDLNGFVLWVAGAISSDGRVIAGYGKNNHDHFHSFIATLPGPCADPVSFCSTSPNSVGPGAVLSWNGTPSLSAADLELVATGCPPTQFSVFYYGATELSLPFGEGIRCVGSGGHGIYRFPPFLSSPSGVAAMAIDFGVPPAGSGPGTILSGSVWKFQYWYRDPSGGPWGFNLSDGLSVEFCL